MTSDDAQALKELKKNLLPVERVSVLLSRLDRTEKYIPNDILKYCEIYSGGNDPISYVAMSRQTQASSKLQKVFENISMDTDLYNALKEEGFLK